MAKPARGCSRHQRPSYHLLLASPATFYMQVPAGHGDPEKWPRAIRAALAQAIPVRIRRPPPGGKPPGRARAPAIDPRTAKLERVSDVKGPGQWRRLQFNLRAYPITEAGSVARPEGSANAIIFFQPTGGGKAAITATFGSFIAE